MSGASWLFGKSPVTFTWLEVSEENFVLQNLLKNNFHLVLIAGDFDERTSPWLSAPNASESASRV